MGDRTLLLHAKIYCQELITTMLWQYALRYVEEKLNEFKVNDDGITPMEKFADTTTYITLKNHHTRGCPVCVLDVRLYGKTAGLTKW